MLQIVYTDFTCHIGGLTYSSHFITLPYPRTPETPAGEDFAPGGDFRPVFSGDLEPMLMYKKWVK